MESEEIRNIEQIIDNYHKNHSVWSGTKEQLIYDLLTTYGDICTCIIMAMVLNPFAAEKLTHNMDALNQALIWVEKSPLPKDNSDIKYNISDERYLLCQSFLCNYAYPYSVICSGYISYSRKRLIAEVKDKVVTFNIPSDDNKSRWNDIIRELNNRKSYDFLNILNPIKISDAYEKLKKHIYIEDGQLCYSINHDIIQPFLEIAYNQWEATKTLPEGWKFDSFSLEEYKQTWLDIAALCYIHFFALFNIEDPAIRINNSIIRQRFDDIISFINSINGIDKEVIKNILEYITFDPSKPNIDIMYQPIVALKDDVILITPMLFIDSNPERNLISLVSLYNKDYEHSKEVNTLEDIMAQDIEAMLPKDGKVIVKKHKQLGKKLPDLDLAIYDISTNAILLCELKWFNAVDSTKELYAREDDIEHGCKQQEIIISYALQNKKEFVKNVFEVDNAEDVDFYCCVIVKHNTSTINKHVPVVNIETLKELLARNSLIDVFDNIRDHKYEPAMPENAVITHKTVKYAGYQFNIPAICLGSEPVTL